MESPSLGFSFNWRILVAALDHNAQHIYQPMVDLINTNLEKDQGNAFRKALGQLLPQLEDAYQEKNIQFRSHMGASLLGKQCKRSIWYGFNWVQEPNFDGRMIRLFNRGHLEEARFMALLVQAGIAIWFKKEDGGQFAFSNCNGHYGGSLDIVAKGIVGYENIPFLVECKTHSEKSFQKLITTGVESSKPEHVIQMNQYMGHYNLTHALYFAVNKNNDEIYCEIILFDKKKFDFELQLARTVVNKRTPPMRHTKEKAHFVCKYCEVNKICWDKKPPQKTCRTCNNVEMIENGNWRCKLTMVNLDKESQYRACHQYVLLEGFYS